MSGEATKIKMTLSCYDVVQMALMAMRRGGASRLLITRRGKGFTYSARAAKGGDVRDFYDHLLEFEVDDNGLELLPAAPPPSRAETEEK